jgi:hypothetical protein
LTLDHTHQALAEQAARHLLHRPQVKIAFQDGIGCQGQGLLSGKGVLRQEVPADGILGGVLARHQ